MDSGGDQLTLRAALNAILNAIGGITGGGSSIQDVLAVLNDDTFGLGAIKIHLDSITTELDAIKAVVDTINTNNP